MSNHTPAAYHAYGYPPNIPENMHGVGGLGASAAATTPHSSHHGYSAVSSSHVQQGRHESQGHAYAPQERATHTSTPGFNQYGGYGGSVPQQYNSQYQAPSHAHQWYGIQPLPPPPSSEPNDHGLQYGARQPPSSVDRPRSRSSRRRQHRSSVGPTGGHSIDYMDQEQLGKHVEQCLRSLGPQGFKRLFNNMPREFQVVIWEAPGGIITDIDTLPEGRKQEMQARINSLRRERCVQLCSPAQRKFWENESWTMTPMSRAVCKRFWDLFRVLPLTTTDPAKWANTMAFLKDCPETAEGKTAMLRNIDFSTQETQAPSTPEREPAHRDVRADSKRGVAGLEALSHASPQKPLSLREPPNDKDSDEFAEWVRARIDADTAGLTLQNLEISKSHKFRSKTKPSDALKSMCEVEDMNRVYRLCFGVYLRKYTSLLSGLRAGAAALKPLKTLCGTLNIDFDLKDLATLLARLRALDMIKSPPS